MPAPGDGQRASKEDEIAALNAAIAASRGISVDSGAYQLEDVLGRHDSAQDEMRDAVRHARKRLRAVTREEEYNINCYAAVGDLQGVFAATRRIDAHVALLGAGLGLDSVDVVDLATAVSKRWNLRLDNTPAGREALRSLGVATPVLFGLTNGHMSYITDADEYDEGGYEAVATLFGRDTGARVVEYASFVATHLVR